MSQSEDTGGRDRCKFPLLAWAISMIVSKIDLEVTLHGQFGLQDMSQLTVPRS